MTITDSSIPYINEGIKVRKEDFGLLVVSKRTPILTFNKDSVLIWNSIDDTSTVAQIVEKVTQEFEGNEDETRLIIIEFLDNCNKLGLIDFK